MKTSNALRSQKSKPPRPSKIEMRYNKEKSEMAVLAQGWVTYFIALLVAVIFGLFLLVRFH